MRIKKFKQVHKQIDIIPVGHKDNPYEVPIKVYEYVSPKKEVNYLPLHTELLFRGTHKTSTQSKENCDS